MSETGYKQGCLVRVLVYGPIDLHDIHWQGLLKASAILLVVSATFLWLWPGVIWTLSGILTWRLREQALDALNERSYRDLRLLEALRTQTEMAGKRKRGEHDLQDENGQGKHGEASNELQLAQRIQQAWK